MDEHFLAAVEGLRPAFDRLMAAARSAPPARRVSPRVPGVYLFSEAGRHLYVGRSNDIGGRYRRHCAPGATHRMAAFAFRLARESTGRTAAAYRPGPDSRDGLMADPPFRIAFEEAKARIRRMEFRFVEEPDPVRQALLEIYCAVVLQAPYNDFDNH